MNARARLASAVALLAAAASASEVRPIWVPEGIAQGTPVPGATLGEPSPGGSWAAGIRFAAHGPEGARDTLLVWKAGVPPAYAASVADSGCGIDPGPQWLGEGRLYFATACPVEGAADLSAVTAHVLDVSGIVADRAGFRVPRGGVPPLLDRQPAWCPPSAGESAGGLATGAVSPSGEWAFATRSGGPGAKDTVLLWRVGRPPAHVAHVAEAGEGPGPEAVWAGEGRIYYPLFRVPGHPRGEPELRLMDVTAVTGAASQAAGKRPGDVAAAWIPHARYRFGLRGTGPATLRIRDGAGTYARELSTAGRADLAWSAVDRRGEPLPPGRYRYALAQGGRTREGSFLLAHPR